MEGEWIWEKKRKKCYYRIRAEAFWSAVVCALLVITGVFLKDELYERWFRSGGTEDIAIEGMQSSLKDTGACYLCGSSDYSLMDYFRKMDSIGMISLNDWYVVDFRLDNSEDGYGGSTFGNTGEVVYSTDSSFSGKMASVKMTLPDDYELKTEKIRNNLCQNCLDKVTESLEVHKWKNERKKAVPLCLVDFQTLEIYSVQEWHKECLIRDYWVEIETEGNETEVHVYKVQEHGGQ